MKTSSFLFASAFLPGNTIAQTADINAAIQVDPAVPLPALQATATPAPSSSYYESVWAKVSAGINTECKICPNSLCSNKNFYGSLLMFRATCWTTGQKINATDMWLQSEEGCYVTVQDTLKYWRNYTEDLKSCQNVPERMTPRRMSARTATECKRCPNDKCETVRSYARRGEMPITCRAQALPGCLENCLPSDIPPANETTVFPWLKTTANCYVKSTSLMSTRRQSQPFEDCGPVPYLDSSYRAPPPAPPTTVTVTTTLTMWYPVTTTIIIRKNPCDGPNCPPLIWAYTPPAVTPTPTSSPPVITPTTSPGVTLTPTSTGGITITSTTSPIVIITPTSTTIITLTPTTSPETTIPNTPITGPTFSTNLTLAPITLGRVQTSDPPPTFTFTISFPSSSLPSTTSTTSPGIIIVPTSNPIITLTPTTNPGVTLTPTTNPGITLTPSSTPGITLTPTNNPGITLTPTNNPGITLTPTKDPGTTLSPTPIDPITFTQTLTLPPITLRAVVTDAARAYTIQNSTRPAKCTCEPYNCKGDPDAQAMCSTLALEKCSKTCPSVVSATGVEPFQPLMSEGGRPPPAADATPDHAAPSVRVQVDEECKCAPMKCPNSGDEANACRLVYSAACSMDCGRGTPATKVVYGGSTVLVITQLISPTAAAATV